MELTEQHLALLRTAADRDDSLKKAEAAFMAEKALRNSGWLSEPLRSLS